MSWLVVMLLLIAHAIILGHISMCSTMRSAARKCIWHGVWIVCTATSVAPPLLFKANIRSKLDVEAKHSWVHLVDESNRHGNVGATS
jgi:hypothetical protein